MVKLLSHKRKKIREKVSRLHSIREDVWESERISAEIWQSPEPKPHVTQKEECSKAMLEQGWDKDSQDHGSWKFGALKVR